MKRTILPKRELTILYDFLEKYGINGLVDALQNYESTHQVYFFKTKSIIKQIPISSIHYIEIFGHDIIIHTSTGNYTKYGTLKAEYNQLKKRGFVKCSQSFLIPVNKISEINEKHVVLTTGKKFPLSRSCTAEVLRAYTNV